MCGRFTLTTNGDSLAADFDIDTLATLPPRYNIAPGQDITTIRTDRDNNPQLAMLRWGLIPSWARDPKIGYRLINARAETVAEKPSFRAAYKRRRCIIPADGFYEWKTTDNGKQAWLMRLKSHDTFFFAGLWESWQSAQEETLETCTLLTTAANATMAPVHHRMPVILAHGQQWLDQTTSAADLESLLQPLADGLLEPIAVSNHVNNPRNDDAACLEPGTTA